MWIFVAALIGMCVLIVTWAIGLTSDVGGLIALAFVGLGILGHMASRSLGGTRSE
jgi:hypothetical protein